MQKKKWLYIILLLVFVASAVMLVQNTIETRKAEEARRLAEEMAKMTTEAVETTEAPTTEAPTEPEPTEEPEETDPYYADEYTAELKKMNLKTLQDQNPDILGWIMIPDSKLSYPYLQGEDNDYYLNHTWEHVETIAGSIYLEHLVNGDLSDYNTIIYGHRMRDKSMFGNLTYFTDPEYLEEHPHVYLVNDEGCYTYRIFSAHEAGVTEQTYRIGEVDEEGRQMYIDWAMDHSVIDTGVEPTTDQRILTMVTCTGKGYDARWVVQGYLVGVDPKTDEDRAALETAEDETEEVEETE
ncbi:MAG: class B sortase [Lachnospiraceae bacterium]|nr:class B sortase [Lachnospiraceae bacterium]MBQ6855841.1 class B sortase [Lachnospiraceae bacterium]